MKKIITVIVTTFLLTLTSHSQTINLAGYNTYVYTPPNPFNAPILLAFHGNGEVTNLFANGLPKLIQGGFKPPKNVYIFCPQERWGSFDANKIPELLKAIKKAYPQVDTTNVYLTGYSAGGVTVMEGAKWKPKALLPMSAAGGGASLVNFIAQNKIPIVHWVGQNEADNIGWTLYQINAKVPNIAKTIIRPKIGHCCWNDVYESEEFWDNIKDNRAHTIIANEGYFYSDASVRSTWIVKENTTGGKVTISDKFGVQVQNKGMVTLEAPTHFLTIHFSEPKPLTHCYTVIIEGKKYQLFQQGTKRTIVGGNAPNVTIECADGTKLIINKNTWEVK